LDQARGNIFAPLGTAPTTVSHDAIEALPQGTNASLENVLLQFPGVSQDSAASGNIHVRNEHANVQYRINGIMLPDGLSGFGQILGTNFIGSVSLITGALPAQYGLRTAGVVDITTRTDLFNNTGSISVYGGSRQTFTPSFEYGGTSGSTQYYFTGRYRETGLGIENPTPALNAIHDLTQQWKGFGYVSTILDPNTRLTFIGGTSNSKFEIPNNPGQPTNFTLFSNTSFDSSKLNENQYEQTHFGILALQRSVADVDVQLAYFSRYSNVHFVPDQVGDLMFNGVASDVLRRSFANGVQADGALRLNESHTLRAGLFVSGEKTLVSSSSQVFPGDFNGQTSDVPVSVFDSSSKLGWLAAVYVSDEWRITDKLTLNTGLRFDQMWQYVDANQLSPRVSLTYKPIESTTFHAGYARNFTPPVQVVAAPTNIALYQGTTQQPQVPIATPMQPERSHVFDVGVVQKVLPGLEIGVDAYYKIATNLIDDGQFGAAYILSGFNYARAENMGVEWKAAYKNENFSAYVNLAWAHQRATQVTSNQYLFGADELAAIATNYIYTDHAQIWTGSAGLSYLWWGTRFSADMIYGSGLRAGFVNTDHVPAYTQVNVGVSREIKLPDWKPVTVRFDIVNVFDTVYEIRDGSGIGVFAPQFGPRRGFYFGLSQKFGPGTETANTSGVFKTPIYKAKTLDKTPAVYKAPVEAAWTWTGYYLGINAGYGWGKSNTNALFSDDTGAALFATNSSFDFNGVIGGAQTGFNWQWGHWLTGIEADLQYTSQVSNQTFVCPTACNPAGPVVANLGQAHKLEWFTTLRGRFGATVMPDALIYVTGGVAIAGFYSTGTIASFDNTGAPAPTFFSNLGPKAGWVVGAGIEGHLGGHWTGKIEYLHMDFGTLASGGDNSTSVPPLTVGFNSRITDDVVRAGINYKFDWGRAVIAKY
jgi:outer membrane receptor protein involved in Fe transport/opacity protein-like surface antigen